MEERSYLGYIAHFLEHIDQQTPVSKYRKLFQDLTGFSDLFQAPEDKVKLLARKLYKSYVLSQYLKVSPYILASGPTTKQLSELMAELSDILNRYGLPEPIDTDFSLANIDEHIDRDALGKYDAVLSRYGPEVIPVKKTKKAQNPSSGRKKKQASPPRKPAKIVTKGRSCDDFLRSELNDLAKERGMVGYAKLSKKELCKELKIKI